MYGKIVNGVLKEAPQTYTFANGFVVDNFWNDTALLQELGYKEIVRYDVPVDTRFKYIYSYEERDGKIYEHRELDKSEEVISELKNRMVKKTRDDLAIYLEENPLVSSCKGVEETYTVTLEKQELLTSAIVDFLLEALPLISQGTSIDEIDIPIRWNAKGKTSEEWTYKEICQLKKEMKEHVAPAVEYQRVLEEKIMKAEGQDVIHNMDLFYNRDKF